jgi:hypothetical protein
MSHDAGMPCVCGPRGLGSHRRTSAERLKAGITKHSSWAPVFSIKRAGGAQRRGVRTEAAHGATSTRGRPLGPVRPSGGSSPPTRCRSGTLGTLGCRGRSSGPSAVRRQRGRGGAILPPRPPPCPDHLGAAQAGGPAALSSPRRSGWRPLGQPEVGRGHRDRLVTLRPHLIGEVGQRAAGRLRLAGRERLQRVVELGRQPWPQVGSQGRGDHQGTQRGSSTALRSARSRWRCTCWRPRPGRSLRRERSTSPWPLSGQVALLPSSRRRRSPLAAIEGVGERGGRRVVRHLRVRQRQREALAVDSGAVGALNVAVGSTCGRGARSVV